MATNDKPVEEKTPDVQVPNVGQPVREKAAGKWAIWVVVLFALALVAVYLF